MLSTTDARPFTIPRVIIAQSLRRKTILTVIAAGIVASLHEATILDSKYTTSLVGSPEQAEPPAAGERVTFGATAYCKGITTASGVAVRTGIAAADPSLLPVGSVDRRRRPRPQVQWNLHSDGYGPGRQRPLIDIYMWSCYEALDFGRTPIKLTVLRLGWNPKATTRGFLENPSGRLSDQPAPLSGPPSQTAIDPQ